MENWRNVVGFEGIYAVSDKGRVKSLPRLCRNKYGLCCPVREKILKGTRSGGYVSVGLRPIGGKREDHAVTFGVHRLVLLAFIGPCPEGMECRHLDGNGENNDLNNLCWGTDQENMNDRERHGMTFRGSRCTRAKLTEEDIPVIRRRLAEARGAWGSMSAIARDYEVDTASIRDIRDKRTWAHVLEDM